MRRHRHAALAAMGWIAVSIGLLSPERGQAQGPPLTVRDFQQAAPRGFGDRNNSWAQAMIWWRNNLYVGTSRQSLCTSLFGIYQYASINASPEFANLYLPYPPPDPDLSCAPDGADLSLQAEIWRWSPNGTWQRVFQSPAVLDNPGPGAPLPARTGKKVPYEITIRDFAVHIEPNGTEALYALGVNSTILWDRNQLPPPRILRTTDGVNWNPIPQAPGTFLATLPFNPDHSSFRSAVSYNGKLFALAGPIFGQGSLIASADPAQGNNSWFLALPANLQFFELTTFNGWLYLGGFDPVGGYAVYKTLARGSPPYQLVTVVPQGAFLNPRSSKSVVSMHEFGGRLYLGTSTFTEIIRINADDTWDLVVGSPRIAPGFRGPVWKYPLSNLDAGFGHTLNDHAWTMNQYLGFFYIGTYNASTAARFVPGYGALLRHNMGAHLYRTQEGWYYNPVTTNGFANLGDPQGGIFDYGFRTSVPTPYGFFLGTANDYYGLMIFRGIPQPTAAPDPPARLEIEPTKTGGALLSWRPVLGAQRYHVYRAEVSLVLVRDDVNFEGWTGATGNKIPDWAIGPYVRIATVQDIAYIDTTVQAGKKYMYYVTSEKQPGLESEPSNLVTFPLLIPPVTFTQLLEELDNWEQRQRFIDPTLKNPFLRQYIQDAETLARACRIDLAIALLQEQRVSKNLLYPDSLDAEILFSKLIRRLQMHQKFPGQVQSTEFCTGGNPFYFF